MGNLFSEEVDKTDPRWYLSQESSRRMSQQLAKTIQTVHVHYKRELNGDKEKAYCCLLRDFDKLLIDKEPTLKGNRLFETRKVMLYRNISKSKEYADVKDFIMKSTTEKIHAAAELQLDIDFSKIITLWFENDEDMSGSLDLGEMTGLVKKLGLELSEEDLKKRMLMYQADGGGSTRRAASSVKLDFNGFFNMYLDMTTVKAVADIFKANKTTPTELMDVTDLVRFLKSTQKIQFERSESYRVIESLFRDVKREKGFEGITYRQFQSYLLDYQINGWFEASYRYVWQDMRQPLTHYFINSSHNTYCSAGQLSGESDPSMYSRVLREGCRCVEIDCWPGGGDLRGPRVTHGGTLMTSCWFRDVCIAINEAAFETSVYPVILSLELHVEDAEQTLMVEIMREIFGDQLLSAKEIEKMEFGGPAFTPLGLVRKILVKCKKDAGGGGSSSSESESSDEDGGRATTAESAAKNGGGANGIGGKAAALRGGAAGVGGKMNNTLDPSRRAKKAAANNRLAAVSTVQAKAIPRSVRGNIRQALNLLLTFRHFNIVSVSEQQFPKWAKFQPAVVAATQKTLIRTYPKGIRIDSSNYSPTEGWALGAQCVALNLQTRDMHYYVNRALFKTNGDSGYVLKPIWMREESKVAGLNQGFDEAGVGGRLGGPLNNNNNNKENASGMIGDGSRSRSNTKGGGALTTADGQQGAARILPQVDFLPEPAVLRVVVICAQNIPIPPNSESVSPSISLTVVSPDGKKEKDSVVRYKTDAAKNNGFDPHWLQTFYFSVSSLPMSFLYIAASTKVGGFGSSEVLLGENAINLEALRSGYRAVPFFNSQRDTSSSSSASSRSRKIPVLLCHFEIRRKADVDLDDI